MNKLLIALIAGTFAATVGAQGRCRAKPRRTSRSKPTVESVTKSTTETADPPIAGKGRRRRSEGIEGHAEGAADEGRQAEGRRCLDHGKHDDRRDHVARQAGVAAAKASKGTPKALPTKQDKQKAVDSTTKANASP